MTDYTDFVNSFTTVLGNNVTVLEPTGNTKAEYDTERKTHWNLDRANTTPACIAQPKSKEDAVAIIKAYNQCKEQGIKCTFSVPKIAVAGGRHSALGFMNDALVIDLSKWKEVSVDVKASTVTVKGGVKLGQMDAELAKHGLGAVTGTNPDTGVIGLSIVGGAGYGSRKYGLAVHNFVEAEVLSADGQIHTCNESENSDLFWGVRGGGGHFGIVTALTMRCFPIRNAALVEHPTFCLRPVRQTVTMVENYGKFMATAPHEVAGFLVLVCKAPINVVMVTSIDTKVVPQEPLENNASKQYMRGAVGQAIRGANPVEWKNIPGLCDLEDDLLGGSFRLGGKSLAIMDYHRGLQTHLEPVQVSDHWYEAAFGIEKLTPEVAQILAHHTKEVGPDKSHILLFSLGGKVTDPETKKDSDTAIECSTLNYWAIIEGRWKPSTDPVENAKRKKVVVDWSRELRKDLANHGLKETPHNFEGEEENLGGRPAFAENGARLQALKKQFDPQNIFSYNKKLNV